MFKIWVGSNKWLLRYSTFCGLLPCEAVFIWSIWKLCFGRLSLKVEYEHVYTSKCAFFFSWMQKLNDSFIMTLKNLQDHISWSRLVSHLFVLNNFLWCDLMMRFMKIILLVSHWSQKCSSPNQKIVYFTNQKMCMFNLQTKTRTHTFHRCG